MEPIELITEPVTVHRIDGHWRYHRDSANGRGATVTHLIRVPEGSKWLDLIDFTKPEEKLHCIELRFGHLTFPANAQVLVMLADMPKERRWPGINYCATIV